MTGILMILMGFLVLVAFSISILYSDSFLQHCWVCDKDRFKWDIAEYHVTGKMNCNYVRATCKHCIKEEEHAG